MKKIVVIFALLFSASFAQLQGNNNAFGLWVGYGANNYGLDFKHLNKSNTVWDIYLGDFRLGDETAVGLGVGFYFLLPNIIKTDAATVGRFPLYWGPSFGLGIWSGGEGAGEYNGFDIGANIVGGISWFMPTSFKMDVSFELISPTIKTWRERRKQTDGTWKTKYDPAFGLKKDDLLGLRLLFHAYLF